MKLSLHLHPPRRLIEDEIRAQRRINLVQARSFAAMLSDAVERYNKQGVLAVRVITELIELARSNYRPVKSLDSAR